jgi:hypothetical protein
MPDAGKFFGSLFGAAAGGAMNPGAAIVDGAQKIIGMFKLSPELKAQLEAQITAENIDLEKLELSANLAQIQGQLEINRQEAASTHWFIAGWRPAVGWVCVLALAYGFIVQPFAVFLLAVFHVKLEGSLPALDNSTLISGLLIPLLGLGVLRTFEKYTNTEGNR